MRLPKPSAGPFTTIIEPLVDAGLALVGFGVMCYLFYKILLSLSAWVKAKTSNSYAAINAAEENIFPPLIGLCALMILPAIVAALIQWVG